MSLLGTNLTRLQEQVKLKGCTSYPSCAPSCNLIKSKTLGSPASFPPVFPFNDVIITINSVCFGISYSSSLIVDDSERSISIPSAIKPANDSTIAGMETISHGIAATIFGAQIIICGVQIIICVTETVICGEPQNLTNDRVPA